MEAVSCKLGYNSQLWRLIISLDLSVMTLFIWDHFLLLHCWETSFRKVQGISFSFFSPGNTCIFVPAEALFWNCAKARASVWSLWVPHSSLPRGIHHTCVCVSTWMDVRILFLSFYSLSSILSPSFLSSALTSLYFVKETDLMDAIFYQGRQEQL